MQQSHCVKSDKVGKYCKLDCSVSLSRIPDGKPPRFPKKPTIRQDGETLIMECALEANPVPDITWYQGKLI